MAAFFFPNMTGRRQMFRQFQSGQLSWALGAALEKYFGPTRLISDRIDALTAERSSMRVSDAALESDLS